ncbi:VIP36-like protein [Salarias fasciatus]|uniref:VIP36-like protein n=1 Tax=Salarias fasciatus TaxID=181472 RepID=A0A672GJC7_SALFA|nr:VIP36-like protein [Salarias fasciatus]
MAARAAVSRLNRGSFGGFLSMFGFMPLRDWTCVLAVVCGLLSAALGDEELFQEEFLKREYSLVKPYRGLGFSASSHWDLMGTAMVTGDYVRLTPDMQSRQGAVWSRVPLFVQDWELKLHFKIHGQGKKNFNGDGMAFWLTKERMQNGPAFGNINKFTGLGIFVDTYPNADKTHDRTFPYVSVMLGNGSVEYDHERDGRPSELGGCSAMVRNAVYDTFILVRYEKNRLTLMVDVDGKQEWKECVDISGLYLPRGYFFGVTSATGDLSDNHDLVSLKLYQLEVQRTPQEEEEDNVRVPRVDMTQFQVKVEDEGGRSIIHLFFLFIFSVLGLVVLVVVAIVLYGRYKENKRKRFY